MTEVVVTPRGKRVEDILKQLLPNPVAIVAGPRVYHFFDVIGNDTSDFSFRDFDGEVLTEYRTFPTLDAAKAWVTEDVDRHPCVGRRPS